MAMSSGGGGGTMLAEINVTPMVDVMLVLLVIFMVTAPMIDQEKDKRKVDLDLPVTRDNPNKINPADTDKLILEITRDLKVQIGEEVLVDCGDKRKGSDPMRFESCFATVEKKLVNNQKLQEQGELYLLADTEIPYGFVVGTMARIKKAGINKLGMVTNPEYLQEQGEQPQK